MSFTFILMETNAGRLLKVHFYLYISTAFNWMGPFKGLRRILHSLKLNRNMVASQQPLRQREEMLYIKFLKYFLR